MLNLISDTVHLFDCMCMHAYACMLQSSIFMAGPYLLLLGIDTQLDQGSAPLLYAFFLYMQTMINPYSFFPKAHGYTSVRVYIRTSACFIHAYAV